MNRFFLILATTPLLTGCALEEMRHEGRSSSGRAFSVGQAKEFLELDYVDWQTKSHADDTQRGGFKSRLHPGDFTLPWDKADYSESDGVAAYDVDILADRKVIAIRSKFGAGGAKAERLNVYQKLVIRQNEHSDFFKEYGHENNYYYLIAVIVYLFLCTVHYERCYGKSKSAKPAI